MSKAKNFLKLIQKDHLILQKILRKILKNRVLEIKEIKLIKDRTIIKGKHKITVFLKLKNFPLRKIVLEIHDHLDCFKRNFFAQTELNEIVNSPRVLGKVNSFLIFREYIKGNFFYELILRKKFNFLQILKYVKNASEILLALHNLKTQSLPKNFFKNLNLKIDKKFLIKIPSLLLPNIQYLKPKIEKNIKLLIKKMEEIDTQNRICLIHGDYTPANLILEKGKMHLVDFDNLEVGNPGRDLGKFICHLEYWLEKSFPPKEVKIATNLFLKSYLEQKKINLQPNLETNINLHYGEMLTYLLIGEILYGKKIGFLKKEKLEEIKKLLTRIEEIFLKL